MLLSLTFEGDNVIMLCLELIVSAFIPEMRYNLQHVPIDLIGIYSERAEGPVYKSVGLILSQIFTYMALTGVEFGFISCYSFTWLVRRPIDSCTILEISRAFWHSDKCTSNTLSTMAALSWLQAMALKRTLGEGKRHACAVPVESRASASGPSSDPDSNATQEDDKDDSDYEPPG